MNKNNSNYYKNHYKSMDWYSLLGFDRNEENKRLRRGEYWSADEIEKNYQNCLSLLSRGNLLEVNLFYKIPLLGWKIGKIENLNELKEKIQLAYETLIDPEKRKEYDLEVRGIFHYDYPTEEIADEKFKLEAVSSTEFYLQEEFFEEHHYWKNYLSDYWKTWQEIIKITQTKEEIKFFLDRFFSLRYFILKTTGWGREKNQKHVPKNASDLIKQEQIRLQNISKEEWSEEINKNKMSEKDIEWVSSVVGKFLEGEKANSQPPKSAFEEFNRLKKWMEQENIEKIILKRRNVVLCKKCSGSGSLYFGSEPVGSSIEIPQELRTKINGVDIGLFFEKIGKNSISRQELNISKSERAEVKNQETFDWTPWIISGGIVFSLIGLGFFLFLKKTKRK